ncbi:YbgC/FadM family acyl-CoA thioesterase, partial [Anaerolineae bacterium CFX9]|nr:YbgC/FadM family acyl-CoA thioesterase [Anaerolineae bacterium CFX9]
RRVFRVRHYECDRYGHVNNANYVRYMQEAAFDASAAVGYDEARYNAMGTMWLVHGTDIEYLNPLRYGDEVEVSTWIADFRRVRSLRQYELRRVSDSALAARATTDWVYLERETQRPLLVPPEMVEAFRPYSTLDEGTPSPRERFPDVPPDPPGAFTMARRVEWRDIDAAGHVNNATYFNYFEECGIQAAAAVGWSMERMAREHIAIMARRIRTEYVQPALLGDDLRVTTFLAERRRTTIVRHYRIERADGTLLARAYTLWMFVNSATQSLMRIDDRMTDAFADSIVP